ncbi:MAG: ABC transporter permease [Acidobacteria bacterium]|nr:ABC transporter permease [Acidobacteriota bacterium]
MFRKEIEIRMALGAGRQRLIRQLMTENLVLAATGSVAALFVGWFAARIFVLIADAPHLQIETDWKIVLVCAGLGMVSTIVFGLAPVLQTVRRGPKATRARQVLVSIQVAVSCVLLILSSLFVRGIEPTFNTQVSFDYAQMIVVNPAFHLHNYKPEQAREATLEIVERIRQLPGVDAAAITTFPPLTRRLWLEYVSGHQLKLNAVEASYFQLMRLPLLQGRVFEWDEREAVVISESAARKLWPNQTPLGKSVVLEQRVRTVIGVVRDSGANLIVNPQSVEAYVPIEGRNAAAAMAPTLRALRIEPASAVKYE